MYSSADDIQIVIRGCLKNDRGAQEQLYKRFYPVMMSLCLRYVRDRSDAMGILNDAFLKIFRHLARFDEGKATLYTWMRTILIHTAIDALRKRKVIRAREMPAEDADEPGIDNEALGKISGDELLAIIHRLPVTTRLVFNLYNIDGYSHREIATMLDINEGTSRWHLNDARRQLKMILQIKGKDT